MTPKYNLTKKQPNGLYRIVAARGDFHENVEKGDVGGFVEGFHNLSHDGKCWIFDTAVVRDSATISGNAEIHGNAVIRDMAHVGDFALVSQNAVVEEYAHINGHATISDEARISAHSIVGGMAEVYGKAEVKGSAEVYGTAKIYDNASIRGEVRISGKSQVYEQASVYGHAKVYGSVVVDGEAMVCDNAVVWGSARIGGKAVICSDAVVGGESFITGGAVVTGTCNITKGLVNTGHHTDFSTGSAKPPKDPDIAPSEMVSKSKDEWVVLTGNSKYSIVINKSNPGVKRIRANIDIPFHGVKAGDLGGRVLDDAVLSDTGSCWVGPNAVISGSAQVFGSACVKDSAVVTDEAQVYDNAKVYGMAIVRGDARLYSFCQVSGNAVVEGTVQIGGTAFISGSTRLSGNLVLQGDTQLYKTPVHEDGTPITTGVLSGMKNNPDPDPNQEQKFSKALLHGSFLDNVYGILSVLSEPGIANRLNDMAETEWLYSFVKNASEKNDWAILGGKYRANPDGSIGFVFDHPLIDLLDGAKNLSPKANELASMIRGVYINHALKNDSIMKQKIRQEMDSVDVPKQIQFKRPSVDLFDSSSLEGLEGLEGLD